jgi:hypothetical protein
MAKSNTSYPLQHLSEILTKIFGSDFDICNLCQRRKRTNKKLLKPTPKKEAWKCLLKMEQGRNVVIFSNDKTP